MKKKSLKVAISGNRNPTKEDQTLIKETVEKIVFNKKVDEVIFGGARGTDSVALLWALYLKETNPFKVFPKLTVIVPCTIEEQPKTTQEITTSADEVVELCNNITPNNGYQAYRIRNETMIRKADRLVSFWDGEAKSGTFMTINLAKEYKKPYEIIDIAGSD